MTNQRIAKLIFVLPPTDPNAAAKIKGHNKFYNMFETGNGDFRAEWGRVGGSSSSKTYPMSRWQATVNSKLRKGYQDITPVKATKDIRFVGAHPEVLALLNRLQSWANIHTRNLYYLSAADISPQQAQDALLLLETAMKAQSLTEANAALLGLYRLIPRQMENVGNHMLTSLENNDALFERELNNLQTLSNQVVLQGGTEEINPVAALGLTIEPVSVLPMPDAPRFNAAFKVTNRATQARFDALDEPSRLLWHGTKPHVTYPIVQNGLDIRYAGYGNFGKGLYHATDWRKAKEFSQGVYFLQAVKMGRINRMGRGMRANRYDSALAQREGYDSVHGVTNYDELIVYENCRTTVGYLVETS